MAWEVGKDKYSQNSNPKNCINAGTTAGFDKRSAVSSSELYRAKNAAIWRIFSLDSRTLNEIRTASALRLPTSKAIDN
jgi:hypothetical protein